MKHNDPPFAKSPATGWQILGELELPAASNTNDAMNAWLMEILNPLNLHADFLNKVLKSAREATARLMQNGMEFKHIHLLVFAPSDRASTGQTWGFFRIEKVGAAVENGNPPDHSIEFYLYLE